MAEQHTPTMITLTRGECFAIAIVLSAREKRGSAEVEAVLSEVEAKLKPLADAMWGEAVAAISATKQEPRS